MQFLHQSISAKNGLTTQAPRANLRELAQADSRMLRELDGALPLMAQSEPRLAGELAEGLDRPTSPQKPRYH